MYHLWVLFHSSAGYTGVQANILILHVVSVQSTYMVSTQAKYTDSVVSILIPHCYLCSLRWGSGGTSEDPSHLHPHTCYLLPPSPSSGHHTTPYMVTHLHNTHSQSILVGVAREQETVSQSEPGIQLGARTWHVSWLPHPL